VCALGATATAVGCCAERDAAIAVHERPPSVLRPAHPAGLTAYAIEASGRIEDDVGDGRPGRAAGHGPRDSAVRADVDSRRGAGDDPVRVRGRDGDRRDGEVRQSRAHGAPVQSGVVAAENAAVLDRGVENLRRRRERREREDDAAVRAHGSPVGAGGRREGVGRRRGRRRGERRSARRRREASSRARRRFYRSDEIRASGKHPRKRRCRRSSRAFRARGRASRHRRSPYR
jgi:hypothetical protein